MRYRNENHKIAELHLRFRELCVLSFKEFNVHDIEEALVNSGALLKVTEELKGIETSKKDIDYFTALHYLVNFIFLHLQSHKSQLTGLLGSEELKTAAKLNADLLLQIAKTLDPTRPSVQKILHLAQDLKNIDNINGIEEVIIKFNKIPLPVILTTETNPYARSANYPEEPIISEGLDSQENAIISVLFYIDSELWANPQVVRPQHLYSLSGVIKLNGWPDGYEELTLSQVTTTNDSWYVVSLPVIKQTSQTEISVSGSIILNYPQSILDAPLSIKMLARFTGIGKKPIYPVIIGYDQLILRAIDQRSFDFPTGYNKLNERALEIALQIQNELPSISKQELQNFLILLSSILNYQGYCYQYAEYKHKVDITEDIFRDNLIKYLSANPQLSSSIIKEGNIAGGRVEINFNGIVAELKVEKNISDRKKIIEKYQKQPAAYASATSAELSILCILDLTEKIHPPSIAAKNIFLISPTLHGFEDVVSSTRIAIIVIDGNTKNPSGY